MAISRSPFELRVTFEPASLGLDPQSFRFPFKAKILGQRIPTLFDS